MTAAFVFPGQGQQTPGMLSRLPDIASVRETLAEADALVPNGIAELDTAASLDGALGTQLALLICGVAATRALSELGARPGIVAGHSIGTFPAAVTAGALELDEAIAAVTRRATRIAKLFPHGFGMLAVTGLREASARSIAQQGTGSGGPAWLANINSADQMVLAGSDAAIDRMAELARAAGARRAQRIKVVGVSHGPLLEPVSQELRSILGGIPRRTLTARYVSVSRASPARTSDDVLEDLADSVSTTVRWRDVVGVIVELGARFVLQMPPGDALVRLARSDLTVAGVDDVDVRAMDVAGLHGSAELVRRASSA